MDTQTETTPDTSSHSLRERLQGLWLPVLGGGGLVVFVVALIMVGRAIRRRATQPVGQTTQPQPSTASLYPDGRVVPPPLTPVTEKPEAYLELRGEMTPRHFPLPAEATIGRAEDNALVIDANFPGWETVSTYHARIFYLDDDWRIEDLNSHNGVYVNGLRTGRNLLRDGWDLGIGTVKFVFHITGVPQ